MIRTLARRFAALLGAAVLAATALVALAAPAGAVPNGVVIVDVGEGCQIGSIDLGTGAVTNLQDSGCTDDLAYGPDGTLYGVFKGGLATWDPATGIISGIGSFGHEFEDVGGLTFDASGRLWLTLLATTTPCINVDSVPESVPDSVADSAVEDVATAVGVRGAWCLYEVDPGTGAATFVGRLNQPDVDILDQRGLAGSCDNRVLGNYFRQSIPAGIPPFRLGSFDTGTAAITDIGPNGGVSRVLSLDFEPAPQGSPQTLWGVGFEAENGTVRSVYTLNQSTGAATETADITGIDANAFPLALAIAPISCPATTVVTVQPTFTG